MFEAEEESPKFQDQEVGELSVVSVNWTVCPAVAGFGVIEKCGSGSAAAGAETLTDFDVEELPAEFDAFSVTVYVPAVG